MDRCRSMHCPERTTCARWAPRLRPLGVPLVSLFVRASNGLCANWEAKQ